MTLKEWNERFGDCKQLKYGELEFIDAGWLAAYSSNRYCVDLLRRFAKILNKVDNPILLSMNVGFANTRQDFGQVLDSIYIYTYGPSMFAYARVISNTSADLRYWLLDFQGDFILETNSIDEVVKKLNELTLDNEAKELYDRWCKEEQR